MARHRLAVMMLTVTLTLAARAAFPQSTHTPIVRNHASAEADAVADTLRAMFAAAQKDDLDGFHALVTSGFYAFDNGQRFDGDALMRMVIDLHGKGAKAVWNVQDPNVHISGNSAWIAYTNVGSLQASPTSPVVPTKWLESATLEKQAGKWKIAFLHSTRMPEQAPAH